MRYEIIIKPAAKRTWTIFPALPVGIADALEELRNGPRPSGVVKLAGTENLWRIRIGELSRRLRDRR